MRRIAQTWTLCLLQSGASLFGIGLVANKGRGKAFQKGPMYVSLQGECRLNMGYVDAKRIEWDERLLHFR